MSILVDLIIILLIGLSIFLGYKRGLIGVAFKILTFFIAIVITFVLYIPVSNFVINNTTLDEKIENTIINKFATEDQINQEDTNTSDVIINYINGYGNQIKNSGIYTVSRQISLTIVRAIISIGLFIIVRLILSIFKLFADVIAGLPIIKQFNKIGGTVYGIFKGFFITYIILAIISLLATFNIGLGLLIAINNSFIGSILYNNNLILTILF